MTEARKLAVSIVVVIIALAGAATWVYLGLRCAEDMSIAIEVKRQQLAQLHEKMEAVPRLRQDRQKIGDELAEYEAILPNESELNKLLDTLSDFQKKAGVEIRTLNPQQTTRDANAPATSYRQVSYDVGLVGDFFSFMHFLNLLETHNRFIQVESFSVRQRNEESLVDEINVRLSTYVYDASAKPVAKPRPGARPAPVPAVIFDVKRELAGRWVLAGLIAPRDPFKNPMTARVASTTNPGARPAFTRMLSAEEEAAVVADVQKSLLDAERLISEDKLEDADKLLRDTEIVRTQPFRDADSSQRAQALGREWQRLDLKVRQAKGEKLYRIAEGIYKDMDKAFKAEDYDQVFKLRKDLEARVGNAVKPPVAPVAPAPKPEEVDPLQARMTELVKACDTLVARATVRLEAAKINIAIQGTFWSSKSGHRRAAAIVNGQTLVEGDLLKPEGGKAVADSEIVVKSIGREKVVFAYKGELIERSQFKTD